MKLLFNIASSVIIYIPFLSCVWYLEIAGGFWTQYRSGEFGDFASFRAKLRLLCNERHKQLRKSQAAAAAHAASSEPKATMVVTVDQSAMDLGDPDDAINDSDYIVGSSESDWITVKLIRWNESSARQWTSSRSTTQLVWRLRITVVSALS